LFCPGLENDLGAMVLLISEYATSTGHFVEQKVVTDDEQRVDFSRLNALE
jgi:hypothetical protein